MKKQCVLCLESLSLDLFYKNSASKDGKMGICKTCSLEKSKKYDQQNRQKRKEYRQSVKDHSDIVRAARLNQVKENDDEYSKYLIRERNRYLRYSYGIDQDIYNKMRQEQECRCAICGIHEDDAVVGCSASSTTALYVDHCHKTGEVRKLLCMLCNTMLGEAKDSTTTLQNAINYLKEFEK
jgi:hypothetical protein